MAAAATSASAGYEFAQPPEAVPHRRGPYRDSYDPRAAPCNIMFDPRVARGNTHAASILPPSAQAEAELARSQHETRLRQRRIAEQRRREREMPRTPEAVEGRRHADVQTETYLEELSDKIPEVEMGTQTEAYLDRPPSPIFVPGKVGDDKGTQIEAGELFDFDSEVEPILAVLVGKTLEQALQEVLEEEELAAIRRRQEEFEQIRNAELAEVQRLEAEVKRKYEEKQRRLKQQRQRVAEEEEVREKVASAAFARDHLTAIRSKVFKDLVDEGHFYDPLTKEVQDKFMPDLMAAVVKRVEAFATAREVSDAILGSAMETAEDRHVKEAARKAAARAEAERIRAEEEARRAEEEAKAKAAAEAAAAEDEEDD